MKDFFLKNYVSILISMETLAALVGIVFLRKYKLTRVKFFVFFLVYVVICERLCTYTYYIHNEGALSFLKGTLIETNHWWSTLYWKIGAVSFFGFYFCEVLTTPLFKTILKNATLIFIITSVFNVFFNLQLFFKAWLPYISLSGAVIVFLSVALYFLELLKSDKILKFYTSIHFYIATAIMFFWLIITPVVFFSKYFNTSDWNFIFLRWQIYLFANMFMYGMFTIGLIVSKPEIK